MANKNLSYPGVAAIGLALLLAAWPALWSYAQQAPGVAVQIDSDDIGGVVTGKNGPEAGVWVIAETKESAPASPGWSSLMIGGST